MKINVCIRIILMISMLTLLSGCYRDGPLLIDIPIEKISNRLDDAIPELMEGSNVAGLSVVVIREGQIAISKSFGYADIDSKRRVDENTVFRAASFGKPIFSYVVVALSKKGKIDLDAPLYSYLNEEVVEGDPRSKIITARMVLAHTTGLPNLDVKSDIEFLFDPGTDYKYSGHAYLYLQRVVEEVTGKHLNELANEFVFKPLKMKESSYVWQDKYRETISSSYDDSGKLFRSTEKPARGHSAWSLFTTIEDYARFAAYTIKSSSTQGSISETMLSPNIDVTNNLRWGLGWGLQATVPSYSFWHWGSMDGFRHYIVAYPKERIAVIVMANSWRAFKIVDSIMAISIGGSYPSYDWF